MKQYESTGQDWFNYIAQGCSSNALIQYIMKLNKKIDFDILKKTVQISISMEPVLGCYFYKDSLKPIWKTIDNLQSYQFCRIMVTDKLQEEIDKFLSIDLPVEKLPPLLLCVIRCKEKDTICIKLNHSVCDGAGSKYYINLLAEIYTNLSNSNDYSPKISNHERSTLRLYQSLKINDLQDYYKPQYAELKSTWGFPTEEDNSKSYFQYKVRSIDKHRFNSIYSYGKKHGTTINSILISSYFLALLNLISTDEEETVKEIQFTIDLRKYLPFNTRQTICNLSTIANVNLPVKGNITFTNMIEKTTYEIKDLMNISNIIHGAIGVDLIAYEGFDRIQDFFISDWENIKATGNCTPMISNFGVLAPESLYLGDSYVEDLQLISPAFHAPAIMLGVSTYQSRLSLCVSYYTPNISSQAVEHLLDDIVNRLITIAE